MSDIEIDQSVISRMQADCLQGLTVATIVDHARASLGERGAYSLVILKHFMVAFGLGLKDARQLEATPIMGGCAMTTFDLDAVLRPKMLCFLQSLNSGD